MAKLTLNTDEVARELKPLLEQHLSDVKFGIDGDKGFVSGKKALFIKVDIRFGCRLVSPSNRVIVNLECSSAAAMALNSFSATIRDGRPYIVALDAKKCEIDLDAVEVGGRALTDFIELQSVQIPAVGGLFAAIEFAFKRQS